MLGAEVERGELPDDEALVGRMISTVCYDNAARFLELPTRQHVLKPTATTHARNGRPEQDS
jgi:hypothetical protein